MALKVSFLANVPLNPNQGSGYVVCGHAKALCELGNSVSTHTAYPKITLPKGKGTAFRTRLGMIRAVSLAAHSDVLLLWGGEAAWIVPRLLANRKRGAVISCSNGLETHYMQQVLGSSTSEMAAADANACFKNLDGLMMVSKFDSDFAAEMGYLTPQQRIAIPNPLADVFHNRALPTKNPNLVLFVGNWLPIKGTASIIEMLKEVANTHPTIKFRFIGAGTSKLRKEIVSDSIETIDPGVSRTELIRHYEEASVLIMPSQCESFGMVASEAMACGCAVVATKTGFAYELVHEQEILHVPFNDGSALAESVIRILDDASLRNYISTNAYQKVQSLTWRHAGEAMNSFVYSQYRSFNA